MTTQPFIRALVATVQAPRVHGRAAIIEVLPVSETIRRLIIKRASAAVIKTRR